MNDSEEDMEDGLNLGSQATTRVGGLNNHVQGALTTLNTLETLPEGNEFPSIYNNLSMYPMPLRKESSESYSRHGGALHFAMSEKHVIFYYPGWLYCLNVKDLL